MKKLLALVLALVMVMGLSVVSTNAAFADEDSIEYKEAVDVMSAIGVLAGTDGGKFDPKGTLTREQGAKIITYMLMSGKDKGDALTANAAPFDDVAKDRWSAGSIEYCKNLGIIAGVGGNKFDPTGTLTGYQFAKMLLVALGYSAEIEKMTGEQWASNVARLVVNAKLDDGIKSFVGSQPVSRETAAQLGFNALTETMVYYPARIDNSDGNVNTNLQFSNVANDATTYEYAGAVACGLTGSLSNRGDATDTMQLCEKYFPKLLLNTTAADAAGRVAEQWGFDGREVIKTPKTADFTFVVDSTGDSFADAVTGQNAKLDVTTNPTVTYVNGAAAAANATTAAQVGDKVEVFLNPQNRSIVTRIVATRYSAALLTGDATSKTSSGVEKVTVPGVLSGVDADNVKGWEGLKRGDVVYYYTDVNQTAATNDDVTCIAKASSFDGQLTTTTNASGSTPAKYTISGTKYVQNENTANHMDGLTTYNTGYTYYTDDNGYIIYTVQNESVSRDYVMVESLKWTAGTSLGSSNVAEARLVFMDGTTKVVNIAKIDGFEPVENTTTRIDTLKTTGTVTHYFKSANAATANSIITDGATITAVGTDTVSANVGVAATPYLVTVNDTDTTADAANTTILGKYVAVDSTANNNAVAPAQMLYNYKVLSNGKYELTTAQKTVGTTVIGTGSGVTTTAGGAQYKTSGGMLGVVAATGAKAATLTAIDGATTATTALNVNDNTVFIVAKTSGDGSDGYSVFTGKNNCPTLTHTGTAVNFTYATEKGIATYVVVNTYTSKTSSGDYVYVLATAPTGQTTVKASDGTETDYNIFPAYVSSSNEVKDILVNSSVGTTLTIDKYNPTLDDNGNYDTLTLDTATIGANPALGYSMSSSTLTAGKVYGKDVYTGANSINVNAPSTAVYVEKDDSDYKVDTVANMPSFDDNDQVYGIWNSDKTAAAVIYVVKRASNSTSVSLANGGATLTNNGTIAANGVVPAYDYYSATAGTFTITPNALVKIEYYTVGTKSTNATTEFTALWNSAAATTEGTNLWTQGQTITHTAAATNTYVFRITAEDGAVSYIVVDC